MQLSTFLAFFLSLLSLSFATPLEKRVKGGPDSENYKVMSTVLAKAGVASPAAKTQYVFIGKWKADNAIAACVTGFSHVVLVVGSFKDMKTVPKSPYGRDFSGTQYELVIGEGAGKSGATASFEHNGKPTKAITETFEANSRWSESRQQWLPKPANYEWNKITTTKTPAQIKQLGDDYVKKYATYNLVTNNCWSYAKELEKLIKA